MKKLVYSLWIALASSLVIVLLAFTFIWNGWIGYMPDVESLQNPISRSATQIYSADRQLLGTWSYNKENRVCVTYEALPSSLVHALIATEDARFYEHSGVDFIALARAIVKRGLFRQESAGGGSTLPQQLAKQLYSEQAHSTMERLLQKPIEWVIAVKLERCYTKEELIALYLNYFDFLHNAVGIKTASKTYFSKEPSQLSVAESALLVGLCKNPSYFNPVRHPERALTRRNVVLGQMLKEGFLTEEEYDKYCEEPIELHFSRTDHKDGLATYFREYLRQYITADKPQRSKYPEWNMRQYVTDSIAWATDPLYGWCKKNHKANGDEYNIYSDGLKIFTSIDSRMQKYAEESLISHLGSYLQPNFDKEKKGKPTAPFSNQLTQKQIDDIMQRSIRQSARYNTMKTAGASDEEIQKAFRTPVDMVVFSYRGDIDTTMTPLDSIRYIKTFLRSGFMSMEPQTGLVRAYVGGVDYKHFMYDMVMTGRRQVGSTIKPYLYSLAMENGFTPCDLAPNVQQTYTVAGQPWTPRNSGHSRIGEMVTLKWGLAQSNNWISAWLLNQLSPHQLVQLLHSYGINNPDIHPSLSLCLGPCDVSVGEMVGAYTTFVNHGIRTSPLMVTRIEDNEGNVLAEFQPRVTEVISQESADKMVMMLRAVIDEGTGGRIRYKYNIEGEIGGKTGTTNRNSDAWFIGFTPQLVSGCWVGGEDRDIHFDSMTYGQGASMALPIWAYYMTKVYRDKSLPYSPDARFEISADFNMCGKEVNEFSDEDGNGIGIEEVYE